MCDTSTPTGLSGAYLRGFKERTWGEILRDVCRLVTGQIKDFRDGGKE